MEIDAHMLCAEDHLPYQGGQYSNAEFEEIQDGLPRPFGEWNCRHSWHPIMLGISPPAYAPEDLETMRRFSTETVTIDGRTKTRYQWSQEMRRCETAIRQAKDTATLAAATGDATLRRDCQGTIAALNRHYAELAQQAGLKPEYQRTFVAGFRDLKEKAAMARGDAVGQWPDADRTMTPEVYGQLKSFAKENGVKLHGFERFDGDVELVKDFVRDMKIVVTDFGAEDLFSKKGLYLMTNYSMDPDDYAITKNTSITINPAAFRNKQALEKDYSERAESGWFVRGSTYHSIAFHEMGHVMINGCKLPVQKIVGTIDTRNISEYAGLSSKEAIAEAFSAYYSGVGDSDVLTIIQRCGTIINERRVQK